MEKRFISHTMTLEPYILEKPAYRRTFNKEEYDIKFNLESHITNEDCITQVVQTVGEGNLMEVLRDHILSLTSLDMDCWYLLEPENYDNIFVPWVYSLS